MNAMQISFFIFAFLISVSIIEGSGIFDVHVQTIDATIPNSSVADGITDISGVSSDSDLDSLFSGWAMVKSLLSNIALLFKILLIPGPYLASIGVASVYAYGVQSMVTLTEIWGLLQWWGNRQADGMS